MPHTSPERFSPEQVEAAVTTAIEDWCLRQTPIHLEAPLRRMRAERLAKEYDGLARHIASAIAAAQDAGVRSPRDDIIARLENGLERAVEENVALRLELETAAGVASSPRYERAGYRWRWTIPLADPSDWAWCEHDPRPHLLADATEVQPVYIEVHE